MIFSQFNTKDSVVSHKFIHWGTSYSEGSTVSSKKMFVSFEHRSLPYYNKFLLRFHYED